MIYIYNECNLCYMFRLCESIASSKQHGGASKRADVELSHIIVYVSSVVILVVTSIFADKKTKSESNDCTFCLASSITVGAFSRRGHLKVQMLNYRISSCTFLV